MKKELHILMNLREFLLQRKTSMQIFIEYGFDMNILVANSLRS